MSTPRRSDQRLARLLAAIRDANAERRTRVAPRTYTPGRRQIRSMSTQRVVREVHRRTLENGDLGRDRDFFADEFRRRDLPSAAESLLAPAVAAAAGVGLAAALHEQGLHTSLASVSEQATEALADDPVGLDESYREQFTGGALVADMQDQGIETQQVGGLDQFAQFLTEDLGEAINDQLVGPAENDLADVQIAEASQTQEAPSL